MDFALHRRPAAVPADACATSSWPRCTPERIRALVGDRNGRAPTRCGRSSPSSALDRPAGARGPRRPRHERARLRAARRGDRLRGAARAAGRHRAGGRAAACATAATPRSPPSWLPQHRRRRGDARGRPRLQPAAWPTRTWPTCCCSQHGDELHAVPRASVDARPPTRSLDRSRRLFRVDWTPARRDARRRRRGRHARCSAPRSTAARSAPPRSCLGLAQRMLEITVAYTRERQQFGQADRHLPGGQAPCWPNVAVKLEFARRRCYRAACDVAHGERARRRVGLARQACRRRGRARSPRATASRCTAPSATRGKSTCTSS